MNKILFVCTGNVFRSMSAEYLLRNYANKHNLKITISSAGTNGGKIQKIDEVVLNALKKFGIDASNHKSRKITKEIIEENNLIVAMAKSHQKYIKKQFETDVPLFNEIAIGKKTSIKDNVDVLDIKQIGTPKWIEFNTKTVEYISSLIENFAMNLPRFIKQN